jgi:hypothetical protein
MLKPKQIEIVDMDGDIRKFTISRFPATIGMEILVKLPISAMPKIGDFETLKLVRDDVFKYVYVETEGGAIALSTSALINNHAGDAETAIKIMGEMLTHNYSFFSQGRMSLLFDGLGVKIKGIAQSMLTQLSDASSPKNKRR